MTLETFSRRAVLAGAAASAAAPAFAKGPFANTQAPAFHRFKIGNFEATAISDGPLALGEPKPEFFSGVGVDQITRTLVDNFQPQSIALEQNALVLNTGDKLVLFDTGLGTSKMFGPDSGRLSSNLLAAGIPLGDIDAVILTHAHPDHCWGLMGDNNLRIFPNAQIYISQADFDFWTDESKASNPQLGSMIGPTRANLLPYRERIVFIKDGAEVLPGVQAMAAPGHTVGHTIYMINSGGQSLCVSADIAHHYLISLQYPRAQFVFDMDKDQGAATRVRVLDMLAEQRLPVVAYHFPWPGHGYIAKQGDGFRFVPAAMRTTL